LDDEEETSFFFGVWEKSDSPNSFARFQRALIVSAGTERGDQNEEGNESRLHICFLWLPYGGNSKLGKESEMKTIPTTLKLDQKSIERIMF